MCDCNQAVEESKAQPEEPVETVVQTCPEPTTGPVVGIGFSFHPVLFNAGQNPAEMTDFEVQDGDEFADQHLLADGLSAAVVEVHLLKLTDAGQLNGAEPELAGAAEHSSEGDVVVTLASSEFGKLKYGNQEGQEVKIPVADISGGQSSREKDAATTLLFITSTGVGTTKLTGDFDGNCSYQHGEAFSLPAAAALEKELTVGSRAVAKGKKGYDALKAQWYLRRFGFVSHDVTAQRSNGPNSEWTSIADLALDGDFGTRSSSACREFQLVARTGYRNRTTIGVAVTFTAAVAESVSAEAAAEMAVWHENAYTVEAYHGITELNYENNGNRTEVDTKIVYGVLTVDDAARGHLTIIDPIGQIQATIDSHNLVIADQYRSAIRLFERGTLVFRLHDSDPAELLEPVEINPTLRTNVIATMAALRREQAAAHLGATARDVRLYSAYRSWADQAAHYNQGRTTPGAIVTNAPAGSSWHNYGVAVDLVFCTQNGASSWPNGNNWARNGAVGVANGLHWGGNWTTFIDRPHLQVPAADSPSQTIKDAYNNTQGTVLQKLQAVWALI